MLRSQQQLLVMTFNLCLLHGVVAPDDTIYNHTKSGIGMPHPDPVKDVRDATDSNVLSKFTRISSPWKITGTWLSGKSLNDYHMSVQPNTDNIRASNLQKILTALKYKQTRTKHTANAQLDSARLNGQNPLRYDVNNNELQLTSNLPKHRSGIHDNATIDESKHSVSRELSTRQVPSISQLQDKFSKALKRGTRHEEERDHMNIISNLQRVINMRQRRSDDGGLTDWDVIGFRTWREKRDRTNREIGYKAWLGKRFRKEDKMNYTVFVLAEFEP